MLQLLRRSFSSQPRLLDVVSKLRDQTSLSMNLCRKAALESNLDFNRALDILAKSANTAFKPSVSAGTLTFGNEGLIGIMGSANLKCLLELRCDSDFVSQNPEFINLANSIMSATINHPSEDWKNLNLNLVPDKKAQEVIDLYRSKFRENIGIEMIKIFEADCSKSQAIGHYIHQKLGPNTGKIGSLVKIGAHANINCDKLEEIGNSLARQAVALGDSDLKMTKFLDSDYLFAPIGTVRNFIESLEEKLKTKITVLDLAYVKIK